jgi:hypothetical protein
VKDYILFYVVPVLLPPAVGAWKGTKWGAVALAASIVIYFLIPGLDALPWLIGTVIGAGLLFLQWIAVRFGSGGTVDQQDKN